MFVRFKLEIGGKEILHLVVHIRSVDQSLSLLTMLYGSPALFAIIYLAKLVLHVTPYRTLFNWHGLLVRKDEVHDSRCSTNWEVISEETAFKAE